MCCIQTFIQTFIQIFIQTKESMLHNVFSSSRRGRMLGLMLAKARPGEKWMRLFTGDPAGARWDKGTKVQEPTHSSCASRSHKPYQISQF